MFFYVGVVGPGERIRALDANLALPGSEVRQLLHRGDDIWLWRTPYVVTHVATLDDDFANYLLANALGLSRIPAYDGGLLMTAQVVARRAGDGDEPCGYHFSIETIRLLAELGANIDIDVNWYV
jgi:hypothetical protein